MVDEESLSGCATSKLFTHALVLFYTFLKYKNILNLF